MQVSGSGTRVGQGAEVGFSNFGSLKSTETTRFGVDGFVGDNSAISAR